MYIAESTYEFQKPDKIDHAFRYERGGFFWWLVQALTALDRSHPSKSIFSLGVGGGVDDGDLGRRCA